VLIVTELGSRLAAVLKNSFHKPSSTMFLQSRELSEIAVKVGEQEITQCLMVSLLVLLSLWRWNMVNRKEETLEEFVS
jgi:hypothetical protein